MGAVYSVDYQSPAGTLFLEASEAGLRKVVWRHPQGTFPKASRSIPSFAKSSSEPPTLEAAGETSSFLGLRKTAEKLSHYFEGTLRMFDLPLDIEGTPFQLKVWHLVGQIPYGETASYAEIAQRVGCPAAFRAVGTAIGKNPLCLIIPCHRVIRTDGESGGYSGGVVAKQFLLNLEKAHRLSRARNVSG